MIEQLNYVDDNVYVGGKKEASNYNLLEKHGITNIICLSKSSIQTHPNIETHLFDWKDIPEFPLLENLPEALELIRQLVLDKKKILVHCQQGISRGPSLATAYLIQNRLIEFDEALAIVKKSRPKTYPNFGFLLALQEFSAVIKM